MKRQMYTVGLVAVCTIAPLIAHATAGLVDGVWFSASPAVDSRETVVYAVIHNQTNAPLEGIATLVVNHNAAVAQEVRVGVGDIRRVAIAHLFAPGTYAVSMSFTPKVGGDELTHTLGTKTLVVLRDTDGDGLADRDDADDDNDGIADEQDADPYTPRATQRSGMLALAFLGRESEEKTKETEQATTAPAMTEQDEANIRALLRAFEEFRARSAESVKEYAQERREELKVLETSAGTESATSTDFRTESERREQQIAAASAATLGWMLDKKFVFYAEIVVLLLGLTHLLWGWMRALLRTKDGEVADEEI